MRQSPERSCPNDFDRAHSIFRMMMSSSA
jgi:hypothetical protein